MALVKWFLVCLFALYEIIVLATLIIAGENAVFPIVLRMVQGRSPHVGKKRIPGCKIAWLVACREYYWFIEMTAC